MSLKSIFQVQYSAFLIPLFVGVAFAVHGEHLFSAAYWFFGLAGIWSLGWWLSSDFVQTRRLTSHHKKEKHDFIVRKFGGSLFLIAIFACCFYWTYATQKEYELTLPVGLLTPANEPTPKNACEGMPFPPGSLTVILGQSVALVTKFPSTVVRIDEVPILSINKTPTGALSVTTDIYDEKDNIVTSIRDNQFLVANDVFEHPRTDPSSLKVVISHKKQTVLDVRYLNPSTLVISGIFRYPGKPTLTVAPGWIGWFDQTYAYNCTNTFSFSTPRQSVR